MYALPAHFLHSVGNFHIYDPIAKILYTGDLGAGARHRILRSPAASARIFKIHGRFPPPLHDRKSRS